MNDEHRRTLFVFIADLHVILTLEKVDLVLREVWTTVTIFWTSIKVCKLEFCKNK